MLTRQLAQGSTVFQGVFKGSDTKSSIKVAVMVGGLPWPAARLQTLAKLSGKAPPPNDFGQ